jgi:hypothetical protein
VDDAGSLNPAAQLRRERWNLLNLLAKVTSVERLRKCRRCAAGETVTIEKRADRANWGGLQTCGSVWLCPLCSARIWAERRTEVDRAICGQHANGGRVVMVTLTMRHKKGDALPDLWDASSDAWRAARGGNRAARRAMKAAGVAGWLRVVEVTHGVSSWHVHVHALVFVNGAATDESAQALGEAMFAAWAANLHKKGYRPIRDRGGLDVQLVALDGAGEALGEYFTKATFTERSAAAEVAGQHGKSARGANRSPWAIAAALVKNGEARDFALWREWEQASKGRRALTWSRGLRDELLSDVERTDEEIAAATDGLGEVVLVLPRDAWPVIRGVPGLPALLLEAVENVPIERARAAVDLILTGLGLPCSLPPPPKPERP